MFQIKFVLALLFSLPLVCFSQCPQYINFPLKNSQVFMSLAEQRLGITFSDSSITPSRDRMIYNDAQGRYIVKLTARNDTIRSIYFNAPSFAIDIFVDWFKSAYEDCITMVGDERMELSDCVALVQPMGETKKVFYLEGK